MYKDPQIKNFEQIETLNKKIIQTFKSKFQNFIKESNINLTENKKLADEYYETELEVEKLNRKIKSLKIWRWFLIIFLVFPFFLISNKIKRLIPILAQKNERLLKTKNLLEKQISSLKNKVNWNFFISEIIDPIWEDIVFNKTLSNNIGASLDQEYYNFMNENSCCTDLIGGELFEHPFAIFNKREQDWIQQVYTETRTITYPQKINGQYTTGIETVVATYTHPQPVWYKTTELVYKTNIATDLYYTNNCSKHFFKKANKKQQISFENNNFDKLCNIIRNDEKQVRVLFTPLAQEQLAKLFQQQKYLLCKNKNITEISLDNHTTNFTTNPDIGFSFDLSKWENILENFISNLFKTLAKLTLPIANIPVYYQMSCEKAEDRKYCNIQAENDINKINKDNNINFETNVIYKPVSYKQYNVSNIEFNSIKIVCKFFHKIPKTTVVMAPSIHKGLVPVTVNYIDYKPNSKILYLLQSVNGEVLSVKNTEWTKEEINTLLK